MWIPGYASLIAFTFVMTVRRYPSLGPCKTGGTNSRGPGIIRVSPESDDRLDLRGSVGSVLASLGFFFGG